MKPQPATELKDETWRLADLDPEDHDAIREGIAEIADLRRKIEAARKARHYGSVAAVAAGPFRIIIRPAELSMCHPKTWASVRP